MIIFGMFGMLMYSIQHKSRIRSLMIEQRVRELQRLKMIESTSARGGFMLKVAQFVSIIQIIILYKRDFSRQSSMPPSSNLPVF